MAHREEVASLTSQQIVPEPQYQCACCEGIVENLSSDAIPNGRSLGRFLLRRMHLDLQCMHIAAGRSQ